MYVYIYKDTCKARNEGREAPPELTLFTSPCTTPPPGTTTSDIFVAKFCSHCASPVSSPTPKPGCGVP